MKLEQLKKEIPYKWRVQSAKYGKATCVAYIDARDCQDLLDEVVGVGYWQSKYDTQDNKLFCNVGVWNEKVNGWVWKSNTGSESNVEKDKGKVSDAFKRACVEWGIGRFLYRLPIQKLEARKHTNGKEYPYCPEKDVLIFDGDVLTNYINWKIKNK
tara:strand:+ start:2350 stop:2817 length:468 start_codon:yes stop_codon:yes gene_type:complete